MLADWYFNKARAISSSEKIKKLVIRVDCSRLIIKHFDHLNNILIFYGSVDKYQRHAIDDWSSKDLITGREIVTDQIPNPIGKFNWLFLTNMPVKLTPKYTIQVISNRPHFYQEIIKLVPEATYFDGTNYPSYAKLVNDAVKASPTEIVIIMGDKVRPTQDHIKKMISLICQGYAFVSLYNFALFGFKKELIRQIGYFDERFIGGGFEDVDFRLRMAEANVPTYIHMEVPYNSIYTTWKYEKTKKIFFEKWTIVEPYAIKNYPDVVYDGLLGPPRNNIWYNTNLTFADSNIYSGPSSWDSPKLLHLKILTGHD